MLTKIIKSNIENNLDRQTVIEKIADLKSELNKLKKSGKYDEFGLLLDKKEKTKQIKNSIKLLEDLKKDLEINNINQTYLENFGIAKIKGNGIKGLIYRNLEKNIVLKIKGKKYIISSYIEVVTKKELGKNVNRKSIKIVIINGEIYELNLDKKEMKITNKVQRFGTELYVKGKGETNKKQYYYNYGNKNNERLDDSNFEPVIYWSEIAEIESEGNEMINKMIEKIKLRNKIKKEMEDFYDTDRDKYEILEKQLQDLEHELDILKRNAGPDDETRKYFVETIKEDMPNIDEYLELKLKEIGGEELVDILSFKDGIDISKINKRKLKHNFLNLSPEDQKKIYNLFKEMYKFGEDNFLFRFVNSNSIDTHLDIFHTIL